MTKDTNASLQWDRFTALFSSQEDFLKALKDQTNVPENIENWIQNLKLLKGIPFRYIIANPALLPKESIRFFQVDGNWIEALIDGSLSVGRATTGALCHDQALASTIKAKTSVNMPVISGFLLRSAVVDGWPGMRIEGYDSSNNLLYSPRLEQIAPSLLLCLFEGVVQKLYLHEPEEGIHFGVDMPTEKNPNFSKSLKFVKGANAGAPIPNAPSCNVVFRKNTTSVLDVQSLADQLHQALVTSGALTSTDPFTAAEFGLQMVEGVQKVGFSFSTTTNQ